MSATVERKSDWDVPDRLETGIGVPLVAPLVAIDVVALAIAILFSPVAGIAIGLAASAVYTAWVLTRGGAALRSVGAEPVPSTEARYINLVSGLASDLSVSPPRALVVKDDRPNALVAWTLGGHAVALTTGALSGFTRTEMEAVVAHCMVRVATGEAKRATLSLALGSLGGPLVRVGAALDVRAVALTRYPPALAAALRRCEPIQGHEPLWLVADGPTHAGREDRAEALLDL